MSSIGMRNGWVWQTRSADIRSAREHVERTGSEELRPSDCLLSHCSLTLRMRGSDIRATVTRRVRLIGLLILLLVPAVSTHADSVVTFNEIMYHAATNEAAQEWVELYNPMSYDMDISGWKLRGGIEYDFTNGTLVPGHGYLVIASSPADLTALSGVTNVVGPLSGRLGNNGEALRLRNHSGRLLDEVSYGDGGRWPVAPDGSGVSLAKIKAENASDNAENWSWSAAVGGTPGSANQVSAGNNLAFNEVETALAAGFWLELVNRGDTSVDLAGYRIRVAGSVTGEHVFAARTLTPGQFVVLAEAGLGLHPADEDKLFLFTPAGGVADAVPVENRHRGRYPEGSGEWLYPDMVTTGAANSFAFITDIVINEIMYNHQPTEHAPYAGSDEEWIELFNRGTATVNLAGWTFSDGIDFTFPVGTTIAPDAYLVVARDAAALASNYPAIAVVGNYSGKLSDRGETLLLEDGAGNPADVVHYYDRGWWPDLADGGGSSLELRDPDADNASVSAWAASDEGTNAAWNTYTYTATAVASATPGPDGRWHELVVGLLDDGEVLLDDISVVEDPSRAPVEFMQNGSFESDTAGAMPDKWRIIGNHRHSEIIIDPNDPGNKVLRLVATSATEHMHNHAETTFANGEQVVNGREYRVSYRAKWVGGSPQLNTRLYFNRCSRTTIIERPLANGTPGARNSRFDTNIGPTFGNFIHSPAVPAASTPITVSLVADDPDGIASMATWYSVNEGAWASTPMAHQGDGLYEGTIPGQAAEAIVQFYVRGQDALGMTSTFPARGPDSRALLKVEDGWAATNGRNNFRIIMLPSEAAWMRVDINRMSNDRIGSTVIYNEETIYYDTGVRHKGSQRHRGPDSEVGFVVTFNSDRLFRGVLPSVAIDRTQGVGPGQREMLDNFVMNRSGGPVSRYTDFIKVLAPLSANTSSAELQMARYGSLFLDEQFADGSDGTVFEYEFVYYPTTTDSGTPEGNKMPNPDSVQGVGLTSLGLDKERYRHTHIIKNNQRRDDYARYMNHLAVMGLGNPAFNQRVGDYIDIDDWLRALCIAVASGCGDNFAQNAGHNVQFYVRPEDQRILLLPHDMDAFHGATRSMFANAYLNKLIADPANERLYLSHMNGILDTAYNPTYIKHWTDQLSALSPEQNFETFRSFISTRHDYLKGEINSRVSAYSPFAVTTAPATVDAVTVTVDGEAWLDVYEITIDGRPNPLELTWTKVGGEFFWHTEVPLDPGANNLTFIAYDYQGNAVGSNSVTFVSTVAERPLHDHLRVTELMYDPLEGSNAEFIELFNSGTNALDLSEVVMSGGIGFSFAGGSFTHLGAGEYAVLVNNLAVFASTYGTNGISMAGEFSGKLNNGGEDIRLADGWGLQILGFDYNDARGWPPAADGAGHSLVPLVIDDQDLGALDYGGHWRASTFIKGSPGRADPAAITNVVLNEILAHTDYTNAATPEYDSNDAIELYNATAVDITLTNWYLSDDIDNLGKWEIPGTNVAAASSWVWFDEVHDFHNPITNGFGLNKAGERLFLSHLPGTDQDRVVDCLRFKGQENGFSLGRYGDGETFWFRLDPTTNAANASPVEHVVISELVYHPAPTAANPEDNTNDEFIEIHNPTAGPVDLWNAAGTWRIDGGVDYTFPAGTTLPAGGYLALVSFDPADTAALDAFLDTYVLSNGEVRIMGPYAGRLSNKGERVALERPQAPDVPMGSVSWAIVDEVIYFDQAPWPPEADGSGSSLERKAGITAGRDPSAWTAQPVPYPGSGVPLVTFSGLYASDITTTSVTFHATLGAASTNVDVRVHWGLTDGMENPAAWTHSAYLGSWTNVPSTSITFSTGGLALGSQYYYSFSGSNAVETFWARSSESFTTVGPTLVSLGGGPTDEGIGTVTLRGELTSGRDAHAAVCWGESDPGTANTGDWQHVESIGSVDEGVPFSSHLTGLLYGVAYRYRVYATNDYGDDWSVAATFTTLPPQGSPERQEISYPQITDDASSGISSSNTYTHAIDFGNSGAATVNGVVFAVEVNVPADGRSNSGTRTYGPNSHAGNTPPAVSGSIAGVFQDMRYNGPDPGYVELTGLTDGKWYDVRLYERAWDYNGTLRTYYAGYDVGGDGSVEFTTPKIDQNRPTLTPPGLSGNVSWALSHVYQADATGKMKVTIDLAPDQSGTYHLYGITNEELPPIVPPLAITNTAAVNIAGGNADLVGTLDAAGSVFEVTVYWSMNNHADSAQWLADGTASNALVGTYTNVTGQSVTGSVSSLIANQMVYYTMVASNAVTNIWAGPNAMFGPPEAIAVSHGGGATGIGIGTATTRGKLTAGGSAEAFICWGASNPGTQNRGDWQHVAAIGSVNEGIPFSTGLAGLLYGIEYSYRVYATNALSMAWSAPATFTTLPPADSLRVGNALDNPGFELPDKGSSGWEYFSTMNAGELAAAVWSYTGGGGLSGPAGPWRAANTSPDSLGDQFAYLQGTGTIAQDLAGLVVGATYDLSFHEAYRVGQSPGNDLNVILDEGLGTETTIYTNGNVSNSMWASRRTDEFLAAKTSCTLTFRATHPLGAGDRSTLIDGVVLTRRSPPFGITNTVARITSATSADLTGVLDATGSVFAVSVYWSTNSANTNAAAWLADGAASNAVVGTYTNVMGQSVMGSVSSLIPDQTYDYTLVASNAVTHIWASPSVSFRPVQPSTLFIIR